MKELFRIEYRRFGKTANRRVTGRPRGLVNRHAKAHDASARGGRLLARFWANPELVYKYLKYNEHFLEIGVSPNRKILVCPICGKVARKSPGK
jgi:hypothetical protein